MHRTDHVLPGPDRSCATYTQDLPTLNGCSRDGILRLCAWRTTLGASSARGALLPFPRTCAGGARAGPVGLPSPPIGCHQLALGCHRLGTRAGLPAISQEEPHPETDSGSPLGSGWSTHRCRQNCHRAPGPEGRSWHLITFSRLFGRRCGFLAIAASDLWMYSNRVNA
jgi:hypothetical protein